MPEKIDRFELPRPDWFDSDGRIYKDRLIENFNALEERLIYMSKLDSLVEDLPDISGVEFPYVTLNDSDDSIVTLKSLIDIMQLKGYPIELKFGGDNTIETLNYYDDDYKYVVLVQPDESGIKTPIKLSGISDTNKYVMFNYETGKVFASSTISGGRLIAVYDNGRLLGNNTDMYADINALYYLARMKNDKYSYTFTAGTRDNTSVGAGIVRNGRVVGAGDTNTKTSGSNSVIFRDTGRTL